MEELGHPYGATAAQPHYYQQSTISVLGASIIFTFILSFTGLLLFSWVRTQRGSIYGSRQFFVRQEHQAEAMSDSFFGWIADILFLEKKEEQRLIREAAVKPAVVFTPESVPDPGSEPTTVTGPNRATVAGAASPQQQRQHTLPGANDSRIVGSSNERTPSVSVENAGMRARQAIIAKIGLDHYLFIRFLTMLLVLSVAIAILVLSVLVPLYTVNQPGEALEGGLLSVVRVETLQIGNVTDSSRLWASVIITAVISALILLWAWSELMLFLKLRQDFLFRSAHRYSSRVVLLQDIPSDIRNVAALKQLFATAPGGGVEHVYLVRDTVALENAVKRRQEVLDKLEVMETRYMDAIARASAMVAHATLSMRSRSWIGRALDRTIGCFGYGDGAARRGRSPDDEDYVGPLKMYQLGDFPKLPPTDLSSLAAATGASEGVRNTTAINETQQSSGPSSAGNLAVLKWYQKPRRPRHYVGLPLFSKRQDSIRYYRGELCRLNKVIAQEYEEQANAMASDMKRSRRGQNRGIVPNTAPSPLSKNTRDNVSTVTGSQPGTPAAKSSPSSVNVLPSAFILMHTCAGAKAVASGKLAADKIPVPSRTLGIPPRDIDWRILGQVRSKSASIARRIGIIGAGFVLCASCCFIVWMVASLTVYRDWLRVVEEDAKIPPGAVVYLRQGILAPVLLTVLTVCSSRILNELCQSWGWVSKMQMELLTQRYYSAFLTINFVVIHPIVSFCCSWRGSTLTEVDSAQDFLTHAIPSYGSFVFTYILTSGLGLPFLHLLQLPRLWATLPTITLWSALGPFSWRKSTRSQHLRASREPHDQQTGSSSSVSSTDSAFEAKFTSPPTLTPRRAFQIRETPFFCLHMLYPHLLLLFTLSLTLVVITPIMFVLWIVVLVGLNLCYRYLVLQVVTTKSQSGGLHYLQAIKFLLFPTLACPPLLLAIYLGIRQAWIQTAFAVVLCLAMLVFRVVVGRQFQKRQERMEQRIEDAWALQPKMRQLRARNTPSSGQGQGAQGSQPENQTTMSTAMTVSSAGLSTRASVVDFAHLDVSTDVATSRLLSDCKSERSAGMLSIDSEMFGDNNNAPLSPGRRRIKRMIERPTTIIGQVRSSIVSSISAGGSRPKSVSVFDLDRYEKEILGMGFESSDQQGEELDGFEEESREWDEKDGQGNGVGIGSSCSPILSAPAGPTAATATRESLDSRNSSQVWTEKARDSNVDRSSTSSFGQAYGFVDDVVGGAFTDCSAADRRALVTKSYLSMAVEEEQQDEKDAKYREIVKALRRASSVASRKLLREPTTSIPSGDRAGITVPLAAYSNNQQRRVRVASPPTFLSSSLEAVNESQAASHFSRRASPSSPLASKTTKAGFRASLPALLNTRPLSYNNNLCPLYQSNTGDSLALSNISTSPGLSTPSGSTRGAPSLPMLLIHRESVVAAKEKSRIHGLYLNPVLQEAKAKVMVWLPSQTEQSFFIGGNGSAMDKDRLLYGQCKKHAILRANDMTESSFMNDESGELSIHGQSTFGISTTTLLPLMDTPPQPSHTQDHRNHPCTCKLYQDVMKAVADAVALADQEIRDLRIVGLTAWLDSRHVVWGQENEEDGRLGDRVIIYSGPDSGSTTTISNGYNGGSRAQRLVGDGLLSWLEVEEGGEAGCSSETHHGQKQQPLQQGAPGIIGGSMGVIMKRPIGYYGRVVGDGEEDDVSRGLIAV
ncbi:hypothetical protein BG011_004034 [Mortierella polycephala]|uniref:CSC1/OSCA1-like 7TM region domain-containing protein n=1 Tax=Mortierella polycephala TaxID=41804 RepID=A0A9P6PZP1_9FUNG|nr:hypothetical protein BG011_004034 [Mortierella polycephala]